MATKLLSLHMDNNEQGHKISEIVESLTSKLFYHGHPINRHEAKDEIGIPTVEFPPENVEASMWDLFLEYESEMSLDVPFDPPMDFLSEFPDIKPGESKTSATSKTMRSVIVESADHNDTYVVEHTLHGTMQANGATQVMPILSKRRWEHC